MQVRLSHLPSPPSFPACLPRARLLLDCTPWILRYRDQVAEGAGVAWRMAGSHEAAAYVTVKDRLLGLQLELSRDST